MFFLFHDAVLFNCMQPKYRYGDTVPTYMALRVNRENNALKKSLEPSVGLWVYKKRTAMAAGRGGVGKTMRGYSN